MQSQHTLTQSDAQRLAFYAQLVRIYLTRGSGELASNLRQMGVPDYQVERLLQIVASMVSA